MRWPRIRFSLLNAMVGVAAVATVLTVIRVPERMALMVIWMMHVVVAVVFSAPIVFFGRTRVHWSRWDLLAFVLPFGVWLALMESSAGVGKSLANLVEPVYFSFAVPIAALVRVMLGARVRERACSISLVALLCLTAICVFRWTPPLPE